MKNLLLIILTLASALIALANEKQPVHRHADELIALQNENKALRRQVDSLNQELTALSDFRNSITDPIRQCMADTSMLKDQDPERIGNAISTFEESKPTLKLFNFGPALISELEPQTKVLSARLKDIESINSALSLLSGKHTETETQNAIKTLTEMSKRTDLSKADTDYADWLAVRLEGEWVVRGKMKDMMNYLIREWQVLPNANEAGKVIDRIVYGKLVDGFYPGQKKLPGEYIHLNSILKEIVTTLENFNANASKLNTVSSFKNWATSIINKL